MQVSALGFGCGAVGGIMVRGDPADQERAVARAIDDPDAALQRLGDVLRANDVVLLLTSGELGGLIKKIPQLVETKYPC
jgi:hypothetical protein